MKAPPLGDNVLGSADAKVTIIEYASMTCPHCAHFHGTVYPALKQKYIDTGKVRLIFREYPLDDLATAVSMLARCAGPVRYFPFISMMFERQEYWRDDNPVPKLLELSKQAGFTEDSFNTCLKDQKVVDGLNAERTRANDKFNVHATPSFFINGVPLEGGGKIEDFDKALEPLLKG